MATGTIALTPCAPGENCQPTDASGGRAASTGNAAMFGVRMVGSATGSNFTGYTGGAAIYQFDTVKPVMATSGFPAGWVQSASGLKVRGTDTGMGMRRVTVTSPAKPDWNQNQVKEPFAECYDRKNRCAKIVETEAFTTGDLPEGNSTVRATGLDVIGDSTVSDIPVKIDQTAPQFLSVTGSLVEAEGDAVRADSSTLNVQTRERSEASDHSGVQKIEVLIDGQSSADLTYSVPCEEDQCPVTAGHEFSLAKTRLAQGTNSISVRLTDLAGNSRTLPPWLVYRDDVEENCTQQGVARTPTLFDPLSSHEASVASLDAVLPQVLAAPVTATTVAGKDLDPRLLADGQNYRASGSLGELRVPSDPSRGIAIGTGLEATCLTPTAVSEQASAAKLVNDGSAALYRDTATGTDTVVRPTAGGLKIFQHIKSPLAPTEFSWRVSLRPDERLENMSDGAVAIFADQPSEQPPTDDDSTGTAQGTPTLEPIESPEVPPVPPEPPPDPPEGPPLPSHPDDINHADAQLTREQNGLDEAQGERADNLVGLILPPWSQDALGAPIPTSLSAEGETITLTVAHRGATVAYPVVADPEAVSAATKRCTARPGKPRLVTFDGGRSYALRVSSYVSCDYSRGAPQEIGIKNQLEFRAFRDGGFRDGAVEVCTGEGAGATRYCPRLSQFGTYRNKVCDIGGLPNAFIGDAKARVYGYYRNQRGRRVDLRFEGRAGRTTRFSQNCRR